ncbi:FecR family protein [Cypionkella sp.]|uniref:FecR family protein n=1 Tax=Cypionkella sp. TaxID=2811411 RepID=UPI002717B50D|nr:FecR family protein [Cypionkella sp.]MDO8984637.1 FecR family protein [Cypionkella sp.]MDP2051145.1 FecR family protein [Cypionkella sp.]
MPPRIEFSRRQAMLTASVVMLPRPIWAASDVGVVETTEGKAWAAGSPARDLVAQAVVFLGDKIGTGAESRLAMLLAGTTRILMGPQTTLTIDQFTAEAGGELVLGAGAMLFDRAEGAPKTPVQLSTAFGLIAVRGTRFFAGPSKGKFGVFVERGEVHLSGGGVAVALLPGFGSDIAAPGDAPSQPAAWKQARIAAAMALVGA